MSNPDPVAVAAAVAGYRLPGCRLPLPDQPLDDLSWEALLSSIRQQDIIGPLTQVVADGGLPTTPSQQQTATTLQRASMVAALRAERSLAAAAERLDAGGVVYGAMDGAALAHIAYPNPGWRPFDHVILLVADRRRALATLGAAGWQTATNGTKPVARDGIVVSGPDGTQLWLHDSLGFGQIEGSLPHACLDGLLPFTVGTTTVRALRPETLLLWACLDAAFALVGRLRACRDVCQLLAGLNIDVESTRWLSRACRMERVVGLAMSSACESFGLDDHDTEKSGQSKPPNGSAPAAISDWQREWPGSTNNLHLGPTPHLGDRSSGRSTSRGAGGL